MCIRDRFHTAKIENVAVKIVGKDKADARGYMLSPLRGWRKVVHQFLNGHSFVGPPQFVVLKNSTPRKSATSKLTRRVTKMTRIKIVLRCVTLVVAAEAAFESGEL